MYRLMIVDDEPIIRRGLLNFIQWESIDCTVAVLATDGVDAIEKLKTSDIDIVISDIKMPEVNGIELTKHIYENYPSTKVIILTAYSDFSFSQSAIRYGAIDFVLKPTSKAKLLEAIEKAKKLIAEEKERKMEIKNLESRLSKNTLSLQEHFLFKVINNIKLGNSQMIEEMGSLGINLSNYFSIIAKIDDKQLRGNRLVDNESSILSIKDYVSKSIRDNKSYSVMVDNQTLCLFISFDSNDHGSNLEKIIDLSRDIISLSNSFLGVNVSIGISNIHDSLDDISKAYNEAFKALSNSFFVKNSFFVYAGDTHSDDNTNDLMRDYFKDILESIQSGDSIGAINVLKKTFNMYRRSNQPIENIKSNNILLYSLIGNLSNDRNLRHLNVFDDNKNVISEILRSKSCENILKLLSTVIEGVCSGVNCERASSNSVVEKVRKYIDENYMNNISLSTIAEAIHVNSSYLSRLYKKETNKNITAVINEVRLEKAKDLLLSTDMKIYEIAESVGIENATYFSILFKKYTGYNPKDYKGVMG
ncbi:response regulator [Wukongibacter baidiensis]|uniref:response regulator n=1 Tax=Wukongibacter baidiensis TaxID=1723361 RepID=UPI003D7F3A53